jgi:hypothetical protein
MQVSNWEEDISIGMLLFHITAFALHSSIKFLMKPVCPSFLPMVENVMALRLDFMGTWFTEMFFFFFWKGYHIRRNMQYTLVYCRKVTRYINCNYNEKYGLIKKILVSDSKIAFLHMPSIYVFIFTICISLYDCPCLFPVLEWHQRRETAPDDEVCWVLHQAVTSSVGLFNCAHLWSPMLY